MKRISVRAHQDGDGWGLDGDVDGTEVRALDAPHALHVDDQNADEVLGLHVLHGGFAGPVHVARELGALNEIALFDPRLHHLPCDVMVIWRRKQKLKRC